MSILASYAQHATEVQSCTWCACGAHSRALLAVAGSALAISKLFTGLTDIANSELEHYTVWDSISVLALMVAILFLLGFYGLYHGP